MSREFPGSSAGCVGHDPVRNYFRISAMGRMNRGSLGAWITSADGFDREFGNRGISEWEVFVFRFVVFVRIISGVVVLMFR